MGWKPIDKDTNLTPDKIVLVLDNIEGDLCIGKIIETMYCCERYIEFNDRWYFWSAPAAKVCSLTGKGLNLFYNPDILYANEEGKLVWPKAHYIPLNYEGTFLQGPVHRPMSKAWVVAEWVLGQNYNCSYKRNIIIIPNSDAYRKYKVSL